MSDELVRAHVHISGRVQGVFFRATTVEHAEKHGVSGWVKNLPDGRVAAVFEGEQEDVERMIEFCHEGPARAQVEDVTVDWEEPHGLNGFERKN